MNKYFTALCQAISAFVGSLLGVNLDIFNIFQEVSMRRKRLSRRRSRRLFSRTALRTRKKNLRARPMRGGFRI